MGKNKDKLSQDWSSVFRRDDGEPDNDLDSATVIDPSLGDQVAAAVAAQRNAAIRPETPTLEPASDTVEQPVPVEAPTAFDLTEEVAAISPEAPTTFSPQRRASAVSVRPVKVKREVTHIDLASALGVGPAPPTVDLPRAESSPAPTRPNDPLLPSASLPKVLSELRTPPAEKRSAPMFRPTDVGELRRIVATTESASRIIPVLLAVFLAIASAVVAMQLLSGGPRTQEHIELRFLTKRGRTMATVTSAEDPSRIAIVTDPPGLLVLHGRDILGKTPLSLDLPIKLAKTVGVELSGPYFERWVGEVSPDASGVYQVRVELKRRP